MMWSRNRQFGRSAQQGQQQQAMRSQQTDQDRAASDLKQAAPTVAPVLSSAGGPLKPEVRSNAYRRAMGRVQ